MDKEIISNNFEDFVVQLYKEIKEAAKRGEGLQFKLSPADCLKWSYEDIDYIECT